MVGLKLKDRKTETLKSVFRFTVVCYFKSLLKNETTFLYFSSQFIKAKTQEDGEEGILFMQEMIEFAKETGMNQGMKRASFFIKDFVSKLFSISKITVFFFFLQHYYSC